MCMHLRVWVSTGHNHTRGVIYNISDRVNGAKMSRLGRVPNAAEPSHSPNLRHVCCQLHSWRSSWPAGLDSAMQSY